MISPVECTQGTRLIPGSALAGTLVGTITMKIASLNLFVHTGVHIEKGANTPGRIIKATVKR